MTTAMTAPMPTARERVHPLVAELEVARKARGLSPETVGRMAGINGRTIRQWECGARSPQLVELSAYAWVLGLRFVLEPK